MATSEMTFATSEVVEAGGVLSGAPQGVVVVLVAVVLGVRRGAESEKCTLLSLLVVY